MKLLWHSYLFPSLGIRAMKLCTETGLKLNNLSLEIIYCSTTLSNCDIIRLIESISRFDPEL
jgi:hypothetical protein